MDKINSTESRRTEIQVALDAERTSLERNQAGQFATPPELALDIMRFALRIHGEQPIRFLEPSCGSGSFISALLQEAPATQIASVVGVELDPRFVDAATSLWGEFAEIVEGDFIDWAGGVSKSANLVVANPPYVRHHHLSSDQKRLFSLTSAKELGIPVSQLAGL